MLKSLCFIYPPSVIVKVLNCLNIFCKGVFFNKCSNRYVFFIYDTLETKFFR